MENRRLSRGKGRPGRRSVEMITWADVYADFKRQFPSLSKMAPDFQPFNYATIKLYFVGGKRMLYDYDTKKLTPWSGES